MKIAVLTFHRAENFGAVLQVYALQTYLTKQGYEVRIIDYRSKAIESQYQIFNPSILWSRKNIWISLCTYLHRFKHLVIRQTRKRKYIDFRNRYLHLTSPIGKIKRILDFDAYIVGSDQVWNLHLTGGVDRVFFLDFPMRHGAKRISYAASSEHDPNRSLHQRGHEIARMLKAFHAISVREEFLKEDLQPYVSCNIQVCLDPTFLLNKSDYLKLAVKPKESNYILVYHMLLTEQGARLAEQIAEESGCKVIEIYGGYPERGVKDSYRLDVGPLELLGYIANADKVITTSFHGLSFSLILEKEFWILNTGNNLRQRNLLMSIGLQHRMIAGSREYLPDDKLDWLEINGRLRKLVLKSITYLNNAVSID